MFFGVALTALESVMGSIKNGFVAKEGRMRITICIGSSCHLKGSRHVTEQLQSLTQQYGLENDIELSGAFCMGNCTADGVSIKIDDELFSLRPEDVQPFFDREILSRYKGENSPR